MSEVEEFSTEEQATLQELETEAPADAESPDLGDGDMGVEDAAPEKAAKSEKQEAQSEDESEGDGEKKGDPGVALQQARQQAREARESQRRLEAQLEEQRQNTEALAKRFAEIAQNRQNPQGQQQRANPLDALNQQLVDEPDPFDDPEGFKAAKAHNKQIFEAQQNFVRQMMTQQAQTQQATAQQQHAAQQEERIRSVGVQHMQDFMIEAPDYQDAENYLIESRRAEYEAAGYHSQEIDQALNNEYRNMIIRAHNTGGNAAQMAYNLAKARGWQPGMKSGGDPVATAQQGLQAKAAAAAKSRSLGAVGGAKTGGGITAEKLSSLSLEDIANYDEDDFLKAIGAS